MSLEAQSARQDSVLPKTKVNQTRKVQTLKNEANLQLWRLYRKLESFQLDPGLLCITMHEHSQEQ